MAIITAFRPHVDVNAGSPIERVMAMASQLAPVGTEKVDLSQLSGRVLAQDVQADRDSPALDVSAVDGYAVRLADIRPVSLNIRGEAWIGQAPSAHHSDAIRIVTGAPVPFGAEAILKREDVNEELNSIQIPAGLSAKMGQNIRRKGENAQQGRTLLKPGMECSATTVGLCASLGLTHVQVFRRVRVSVVVSGNEILDPHETPQPWQLRDSNGPAIVAMLAAFPWIHCIGLHRVSDDLENIRNKIEAAASQSDSVILTGGVSMGDHDFAQQAVAHLGAKTYFHGLPIRPGMPMLGAVTEKGIAIFGLPGNPVAALVTARRFALVALRRLAGLSAAEVPVSTVEIQPTPAAHRSFWTYPLVRLTGPGRATIVASKGSGDLVAASQSDGFVEISPASADHLSRPYYLWRA